MAPTCAAEYLTRDSVLVVDAVRLMSPLRHTWRGLVEEMLRFRGIRNRPRARNRRPLGRGFCPSGKRHAENGFGNADDNSPLADTSS
jgi:hypothetical protein